MLLDKFGGVGNPPQHLETFLPLYRRKLEEVIQASGPPSLVP